MQVAFRGTSQATAVQDAVNTLRDRAASFLQGSGLRAGLTGDAAIVKDMTDSFGSAEKIVGAATVLLIVVLLGLIFRSPIASLLPIVSIGLVYAVATSALALLARAFGFHVDQSDPDVTALRPEADSASAAAIEQAPSTIRTTSAARKRRVWRTRGTCSRCRGPVNSRPDPPTAGSATGSSG